MPDRQGYKGFLTHNPHPSRNDTLWALMITCWCGLWITLTITHPPFNHCHEKRPTDILPALLNLSDLQKTSNGVPACHMHMVDPHLFLHCRHSISKFWNSINNVQFALAAVRSRVRLWLLSALWNLETVSSRPQPKSWFWSRSRINWNDPITSRETP